MKEEKSKKKKNVFLRILKKAKPSRLIFLALLLVANTYAWFIYINTVSNSVDVHIKSWKIDFTDENTPITDYVNVSVNNVYPGMATYTKNIVSHNYSDVPATATFSILSAKIMGTEYITVEGREETGQTALATDPTSAELTASLASDYPFTISLTMSNPIMVPVTGSSSFSVVVSWPYESGDDDLDTQWGINAYNFKQQHPSDPCIELVAKIYITQASS